MRLNARKIWPSLAAILVYWTSVIILVALSIGRNDGHLVYPLDDTYIHMAMAKNVALHHVWGVTPYEFTSASSSPLWTALLSGIYLIVGFSNMAPLILNMLFGAAAVVMCGVLLDRFVPACNSFLKFVVLLVAMFVAPLPSLTVVGMEHVLHAFLTLWFAYMAVNVLSGEKPPSKGTWAAMALSAALVSSVRYEGLFLVFAVCVMSLLQKKVMFSIAVGAAALFPLVAYGLWSVAHGWYFIPNSVLLKALSEGHASTLLQMLQVNFIRKVHIGYNSHVLLLLIASLSLLLFLWRKKDTGLGRPAWYANLIFVSTLLLHMQFASTGWFYRYEAYVVLLGIIVIACSTLCLIPEKPVLKFNSNTLSLWAIAVIFLGVVSVPFTNIGMASLMQTPQAMNNIYGQQYQMGRFFDRFYRGQAVAVNDIGAVSCLADVRLIDLWGLATFETGSLKMRKLYDGQAMDDLCRKNDVKVAIIYEQWFSRNKGAEKPRHWVLCGRWTIPNNVVAGDETVAIYAVDPSVADKLVENLVAFGRDMPDEVTQSGPYVEIR